MNKEQLIATLQACYFGDKGAFNKILKEYKKLQQENKQLKDRINTYENPDDLTLMFMYCEEKAKDKIKELKEENKQLKAELELYKGSLKKEHEQVHRANDLEDRIDKAIELIKDKTKIISDEEGGGLILCDYDIRDLLETLKGE